MFAGEPRPKTFECFVVFERRALRFVIEIVIELYAIDIIFLNDFGRDIRHPLAHIRNTRIKHITIRRYSHPAWIGFIDAGRRIAGRVFQFFPRCWSHIHRNAIRIEPCMQLDPALMRFRNCKAKWIEARIFSERTREIRRPRQILRFIESIGSRRDLKNHGIDAMLRRLIKHPHQLFFLTLYPFGIIFNESGSPRRPIEIKNSCNPACMKRIAIKWHGLQNSRSIHVVRPYSV